MPRPFTRAQALQNDAFLERLALSGNVRLAAREVGVKYSTVQHRRATHADFAQAWEGVIAAAHGRFHLSGGPRPPEACPERSRRGGGGGRRSSRLLTERAGQPFDRLRMIGRRAPFDTLRTNGLV